MPRKAKDEEVIENTNMKKSATSKKVASTTKSASTKKAINTSKKTTKSQHTTTKKSVPAPKSTSAEKSTSAKKTTSAKKPTTTVKTTSAKKSTTAKTTSTKKAVATKKSTNTSKTNSAKSKSKKTTTKRTSKKIVVPVEYYDLPTAYDKTIVKILAQTPSCLFVYWEISEKDKLKFQKQYGEGFFQDTKPYLIIINETMDYSFEIEINDYANSWYIHIHDSDCKYAVKLIRKPINNEVSISSVIDIISSNEIDAPNDHILFDRLGKTVFFKNIQTNIVNKKDISSLSFISNIGKIYNIYDFYKEIYKNELNGDELGVSISSSQFSSFFK